MAQRHRFSEAELEQYFDRICLPQNRRIYDVHTLSDEEKLTFLNLVQKHQLVKVPWENLTQHYSWHRVVNVKPKHLFNKIVHGQGRGGYCMEVNFFYHLILYSLGFNVYMSGSRIYRHDLKGYGGWTHVVNLVTIAETRYLCDGGFGGQGPSRPLPVEDHVESTQIAPAQSRIVYENIAQNMNRSQKVWIYQYRRDDSKTWTPMYCFVDLEFTPEDIESMNFAPWLSRRTFFTHTVVAVRFTTDRELEDGAHPGSANEEAIDGELDGSITINHDVLKWHRRGEKVLDLPFKTDSERVAALAKYFGIFLPEEDRDAITNTMAMIGVKAMGEEE